MFKLELINNSILIGKHGHLLRIDVLFDTLPELSSFNDSSFVLKGK